jgi:hypothetical protein
MIKNNIINLNADEITLFPDYMKVSNPHVEFRIAYLFSFVAYLPQHQDLYLRPLRWFPYKLQH